MPTVLIVDDDPSHLKLYSWIVQRGGYDSVPTLVQNKPPELPRGSKIDIAVVDYRLGDTVSALDVAKHLKAFDASMPILILSDLMWMPEDVVDYATGFVRKGDPEQLLEMIAAATNSRKKTAQK